MLGTDLYRRRLLVAAAVFAGSAEALRSGWLWAQTGSPVAQRTLAVMVAAARRLYPHDDLPDAVYAEILDAALSGAAADPALADTYAAAERALNAQQNGDFADLDETGQITALRAVQEAAFFARLQTTVRIRLYNHPAFWALIGYEGPAWQFGGYLNRGAGEIDWLEEAQ